MFQCFHVWGVGADILTLDFPFVPSTGVGGVFVCGSSAMQDPHMECRHGFIIFAVLGPRDKGTTQKAGPVPLGQGLSGVRPSDATHGL